MTSWDSDGMRGLMRLLESIQGDDDDEADLSGMAADKRRADLWRGLERYRPPRLLRYARMVRGSDDHVGLGIWLGGQARYSAELVELMRPLKADTVYIEIERLPATGRMLFHCRTLASTSKDPHDQARMFTSSEWYQDLGWLVGWLFNSGPITDFRHDLWVYEPVDQYVTSPTFLALAENLLLPCAAIVLDGSEDDRRRLAALARQ